MPSNINLFRRHNYNPVFIETGSYAGDGIKNAIFSGYEEIHSIELVEKHYQFCKSHFQFTPNVNLCLGDSVAELPSILSKLDKSATFWLDAHYSGGDTTFKDTLTPLIRELVAIKNHPIKNHTILIDDLREWQREFPAIGFGLKEIKEIILDINPDYVFSFADGQVANDILVAETRKFRPVNIIVFSKDRAMQLDMFIRTFNNYVKLSERYNIQVLYTASNDKFQKGYDKLMGNKTPNVTFLREINFKEDLIKLINKDNAYTVFFVDDDFFKNSFDFFDYQMDIFDWDERIACRSMRLHTSLEYCYTSQKPMKQPPFLPNNVFDWTIAQEDYGYPMSVDGHIFRTKEIIPFLLEMDYSNPNTFESVLVHKRNRFGRYIICYDNSAIVNNPINKVQTVNGNISGNITAESLNDKFLDGFIIDITPFGGFMNKSAHQELPLNFIDTKPCTQS